MPLDNAIRRMREADADLTATIERGLAGYEALEQMRQEWKREAAAYRRYRRLQLWAWRIGAMAAAIGAGMLLVRLMR